MSRPGPVSLGRVWVFQVEDYIQLALLAVSFVLEVWAVIDALIRPSDAFHAAQKLTKPGWVVILLLALVTLYLIRSPISIFGLLGVVAAGVYLADVRPAVREISGR